MRAPFSRQFFLIVLFLLLTACARDYAYRTNLELCSLEVGPITEKCAESALVNTGGNKMIGFVEFDDQGQLRDPKQMDFVLTKFGEIAQNEDVIIITFVHGWHHNASYDDENASNFNNLLKKVSKAEAQTGHRKVLGLYIGWRGESIVLDGINVLTFWDRKNTAQKVGSYGLVELLLKLEEIVNVRKAENGTHNSRLIIAGHSFGGAVIYSALQQILEDRFIDSRSTKSFNDDAKGFADLVILINPAFEALRYSSLYNLSQQRCSYFETQRPKLLILTSEADSATGFFFPLGRFFSTIFETHNDISGRSVCTKQGRYPQKISEGEADRSSVGHFKPYLTHVLNKSPNKQSIDIQKLSSAWALQSYGNVFNFSDTQLEHLGRSHPLNPYLNLEVEDSLIPNHNDFWGDEILNFLRDFIAISISPTPKLNTD